MKKQNLHEEIYRIKKLMNFETSYDENSSSLNNLFEDITSSTEKCKTTKNEIQTNEVAILAFDKNKMALRAGMKLFFGATKTGAQIKDVFNKLFNLVLNYENVDEVTKGKLKSGEFVLGIPKILNVIGSASSFRGVPVMPTITNNKALINIGAINSDSFVSNVNRNDIKYKNLKDDEKNNGYASGRIQTITDFIRTPGNMPQIQSGTDVEVKKSVAVITDTGPCADEFRDTDKYPNPGQFAYLEVYVTIGKKIIPQPIPSSCINKITIKIGYEKDLVTTELQKHECDFGVFNVYANDVFIKTININNYVFDTGLKDSETNADGLKITDFTEGRYSDGLTGGTRTYTIVIKQNDTLWSSIMANAPKFGNTIRISYKGFPSAWYAGKKIYAQGARNNPQLGPAKKWDGSNAESHSSAVYLDITLNRTNNKTDNVKGWTTATARGTQLVTIAELTPCLANSANRIVIS